MIECSFFVRKENTHASSGNSQPTVAKFIAADPIAADFVCRLHFLAYFPDQPGRLSAPAADFSWRFYSHVDFDRSAQHQFIAKIS